MVPFSGMGSAIAAEETAGKDVLSKFKDGGNFKVVGTVHDLSPLAHSGFVVPCGVCCKFTRATNVNTGVHD